MNNTVVIFESKYGFTRRYARWISEALSCPCIERKAFLPQDFEKYNIIIYGGGLYAGSVNGIKLITENWNALSGKKVILFTCGLADPGDPDNITHIREGLSKVLSAEMMNTISFFHLQGGMDYRKLSFLHRSMISMLHRMLLKKDSSDLSNMDRQILDAYGNKVDFTDRNAIQPLVTYTQSLTGTK